MCVTTASPRCIFPASKLVHPAGLLLQLGRNPRAFVPFLSSFLQLNPELLKENCSRGLGGFSRTAPRQWPGRAWAWHRPPAGTGSPCRIRRPRAPPPLLCPREWHALANKCHLLLKAPPGSGRAAPVMNKRFAVAPLLGRRRQAGTAGSKAVRHAQRTSRTRSEGHKLYLPPLPAAGRRTGPAKHRE